MYPGEDKKLLRKLKFKKILKKGNNSNLEKIPITIYTREDNQSEQNKALLLNEINNQVTNKIHAYLTKDIIPIQLTVEPREDTSLHTRTRRLFKDIIILRNKNIITNGNIGSAFQDFVYYNINHGSISYINIFVYPIGTLGSNELYVDSFMRWDDNKILCIDKKPYYTISDYKIVQEFSFDKNYKITLDLYIDKNIKKNIKIYEVDDKMGIIL